MATLVLSAVGGAVGASIGGAAFGLSSVVIGKAIGATIGRSIDSRLLGGGSSPVERGRTQGLRVLAANEGASIPRVYGAMRVAGQVIWATQFLETVTKSGGSKFGSQPKIKDYSYSISFAIALCEGEISHIGKVWADGSLLSLQDIEHRVYLGTEDQMPDALISAIEGSANAPAYRGLAYIVFENFDLTRFGNRIPHLNFEVFRNPLSNEYINSSTAELIPGVALIPGSGEYALATEPVKFVHGKGKSTYANVHGINLETDFIRSMDRLEAELPNCGAVSLVVSWFGDDLRCSECEIAPAVEQSSTDAETMNWQVSGVPRSSARTVSLQDGRPNFGGTPTDESVIQAIQDLNARGKEVMFYPFILMDIPEENSLPNPYDDTVGQAAFAWRGRITSSKAPGVSGSVDGTAAIDIEIDAFFGTANVSDFAVTASGVTYSGPAEWSYRRFILHYAHLCQVAGGVESFCIGSELRGLTQLRNGLDSFPVVEKLKELAADVRSILGSACKIGYAADWSEYFGYHPANGDVFFHLDALWADQEIDFVGIDNYMPLSDWRDSPNHADEAAGTIYNLDYLQSNIEGGEGYDWYYPYEESRDAQKRFEITDGSYNEPWVYRYKDIRNWWSKQHFNRLGGVRSSVPTAWLPGSKPIRFTEIGCPSVDKGTNQPNVFVDPKSSESAYPYYSNGNRDDLIQHQYLQAMLGYWGSDENNPEATQYEGRMIDIDHTYAWAWDTRPYPDFPDNREVWSDGAQFAFGHWISGKVSQVSLGNVVREICGRGGVDNVDVSELYGLIKGYLISGTETARQSLQPLMLAHSFDSRDSEDKLSFRNRDGRAIALLDLDNLVYDGDTVVSRTRSPDAEMIGRLRVGYVNADEDYQSGAIEHVLPDIAEPQVGETALEMALTPVEAKSIAERMLTESRIARDEIVFSVPPSYARLCVGDVVILKSVDPELRIRIDRIEDGLYRKIFGTRIETGVYAARYRDGETLHPTSTPIFGPPYVRFLDVPELLEASNELRARVIATADPWPGRVAIFASQTGQDFDLETIIRQNATIGEMLEPLQAATPSVWQKSGGVRIGNLTGQLASRSQEDVLNGANIAAIRNGETGDWEIIQFADAILVGPGEYRISNLLRGQAGTEHLIPENWPTGSEFILLDSASVAMSVPSHLRGVERHYRVGPAQFSYDSEQYIDEQFSANGVGLRPYSPVHLSAEKQGNDIALSWVRRTRVNGDSWQSFDVPLGEEAEVYNLRIIDNSVVREVTVSSPSFIYTAAMQAQDGITGSFEFEVAQISEVFGPGPFSRRSVDV